MSASETDPTMCGNCEAAPWEAAVLTVLKSETMERARILVHVCRSCGMFAADP